MNQQPHTRAFLLEFLNLDPPADQLPIDIITSMHREQLRLPLRRLAQQCERRSQRKVLRALKERYPALRGGTCFSEDATDAQVSSISRSTNELDAAILDGYANIERIGVETMELLLMATDEWQVYEPLSLLYTMSLSSSMAEIWVPLLELGLFPEVRAMLLNTAY